MKNYEDSDLSEAIAIISMNGRFPGAKNVEQFWSNLYNGVESVKFFSREELIAQGIDDHLLDNEKFVAADAVLEDIDKFDASFFDYSTREAEIMDPQHRIFLECAWEAMESAGYNSELYDGRVAVFAGSALSGYMVRNLYSNPGLVENVGTFKIMISNSQDFLATRVSYKMNFMGPSVNVNTLCSSSLVAVDMACKNLLEYNSDIAIAGGVSFQVSRNEAFFYQEGGIGSADGHCKAYDSRANGTTSGSGLSLVVLKRYEDALEDGDYIHGVIIGSAVNNDGSNKNSYTAPNVDGQAECIAEAIAMADINPETISYIEGHGTGTNLGDPIEVAGLTKAFRSYTNKKQFCALGSVKTNIGHLVTAGGVASLIKTVMAMQNKVIPASLNFEEPNQKIDFINSPFYVNHVRNEWNTDGSPRRAGISSFGIGGTNAHVIVQETPEVQQSDKTSRMEHLILLSAKTQTALEKMSDNLKEHINNKDIKNIEDIAFTLQVGRKNMDYRKAILCEGIKDLAEKLEKENNLDVFVKYKKKVELPIVFMFSNEKNTILHIDKDIYDKEPLYRKYIEESIKLLENKIDTDLFKVLYPTKDEKDWVNAQLSKNNIKRLAAFITQYAMAKVLIDMEINPTMLVGEGVGEYVCACISNVIKIEDILDILATTDEMISVFNNEIVLSEPEIDFISNVSGENIKEFEATDIDYWLVKQRQGNKYLKGLENLIRKNDQIYIGMGDDYSNAFDNMKIKEDLKVILVDEKIIEDENRHKSFVRSLGKLWLEGVKINWNKLYEWERRCRIPLPTYPFEHKSYWIDEFKGNNTKEHNKESTLSKLPRPELDIPYVEPRDEIEKIIAGAWEEALGYEQLGINDNFFELGGHSLIASAIAAELAKTFKVQIPLRELYEAATIEEVAKLVDTYKFLDNDNEEVINDDEMEFGVI